MSDEVFELNTTFNDVAELGQGYVDRADGERILLSLPRALEEGEAVRFIILLADGTPAFAGAGRCVQVSDQGEEVAASERYETLLDALAFDERSQPVYDYIVAVRQMAYAAEAGDAEAGGQEAQGAEGDEADKGDEAIYDGNASISAWPEATNTEQMSQIPEELAAAAEAEIVASDAPPEAVAPSVEPTLTIDSASFAGYAGEEPEQDATVTMSGDLLASVLPQPLPTGILTRPAIAAHWQPMAPRPPRPSTRPSRFRYAAGTLPAPAEPPRPDLDPSLWVQAAVHP